MSERNRAISDDMGIELVIFSEAVPCIEETDISMDKKSLRGTAQTEQLRFGNEMMGQGYTANFKYNSGVEAYSRGGSFYYGRFR